MTVEILACPGVTHRRMRVRMAGGDLRVPPASSIVVTKVWRSMCGCIRGSRTTDCSASRRSRRVAQPVHPPPPQVEQDWPRGAVTHRVVDGLPDRWRKRHQNDLGAFADDAQHPVPVLLTDIGDVPAAGLEDP